MNEVTRLLHSHRSIRKFTAQPVDDAWVAEIVACGQAAASSSNIQAGTVIRVRDPRTRARIAELSGNQEYIVSCGAFLVFCADLNRARMACEMRGGTFVPGMTEHFIIATADVALLAQNCVVAAESMGLGTCYIGSIRNRPDEMAELLGLPGQVYPVFGLCLGHPDQDPERKPRLPLPAVLMEERYDGEALPEAIRGYDEVLHDYYLRRTGGTKDSCWSEEMKAAMGKEARPHMRAFLAGRGMATR